MSEQQIKALYYIKDSLTRLKNMFENELITRYRDKMDFEQQKTLNLVQYNILKASSLFPSGKLPKDVLRNLQRYLPSEIDKFLHDANVFTIKLMKMLPDEHIFFGIFTRSIKSELVSIQKNMAIVRSETINQEMSLDSNLPNQYFVQTTRQRHT